MKKNIGKLDRLIRIVIGGFLFLAFLQGNVVGVSAIFALLISGILMLTSILGSCPIYSVFNLDSSKL